MNDSFIFSADLGYSDVATTVNQYETLFSFARDSKANNIILGGDLTPLPALKNIKRDIFMQRDFYFEFLVPLVAHYSNHIPDLEVYLMPGNNDLAFPFELFEEVMSHTPNNPFTFINEKRICLSKNIDLVGYSSIPLSPFILKDWEKIDIPKRSGMNNSDIFQKEALTEGLTTKGGKIKIANFNSEKIRSTIEDDLSQNLFTSHPEKTIYVLHCPPKLTNLDRLYSPNEEKHVGSRAIREFIEIYQPLATLHGHINETVDVSKEYKQKIGDSVSYSVGNGIRRNPAYKFFLSALTFNIKNIHKTLERKLIPLKN